MRRSPSKTIGSKSARRVRARVTVDDVLITPQLRARPGVPNPAAENQLLQIVAQNWNSPPATLIRALVHRACDLCRAGSAGLSLLEIDAKGRRIFRWTALAGAYHPMEGATISRECSPCGTTLDLKEPQLFSRPARFFHKLRGATPPIVEGLVVPIFADDRELGSIWIVSHDADRTFDSEDAKMLTSIAAFTGMALRNMAALENLRSSEAFKNAVLLSSADCIKVLDASGKLLFLNDYGAQLLGLRSTSAILGKDWFGFWDGEDKTAAIGAFRTAQAGGVGVFQGSRPTLRGEPRWWNVCVTAMAEKNGNGGPSTFLAVSRDVTQQVTDAQKVKDYAGELEQRVAERTNSLIDVNQRLQRLSRKLVRSQQDERRRIANEMHDEIGQQLTSLKMILENASGGNLSALADGSRLLLNVQEQIRSLSFTLRQSLPDHIGLITGLRWHFRELQRNAGLKIRFTQPRQWDERLSPEIEHTLYRVIQEALNNVVKHARVSNVSVRLQNSSDGVLLAIRDRGCGFNHGLQARKRTTGLALMEERVLLVGGEFRLSTAPKRGTEIFIKLPPDSGDLNS